MMHIPRLKLLVVDKIWMGISRITPSSRHRSSHRLRINRPIISTEETTSALSIYFAWLLA